MPTINFLPKTDLTKISIISRMNQQNVIFLNWSVNNNYPIYICNVYWHKGSPFLKCVGHIWALICIYQMRYEISK